MADGVVSLIGASDPRNRPSLALFPTGVALPIAFLRKFSSSIAVPIAIISVRHCRRSPRRYRLLIFARARASEIVIAG